MIDNGEFAQAARLFDRLAAGARRGRMPIQPANLTVRATQAYLAHGEIDPAPRRMRRAIRVLAHHHRGQRVAHLVSRADDELREGGYDNQAVELARFASSVLGEAGLSLDSLKAPGTAVDRHGFLPGRCEGCGAPLVPGDVTWHDAQTAECPYCGAVIKAD